MNVERFKGADWFLPISNIEVSVLGAGGIGSWTTLMLSRANVNTVYLVDFDSFEEVNLGGQFVTKEYLNLKKTDAVRNLVLKFSSNTEIININTKMDENSQLFTKIIISAFDNIEARKIVFNNWKTKFPNDKEAVFIDGRLEAEFYQIFTIRGDDKEAIEKYEKEQLFDDNDIPEAVCSYKQTSHIAAMLASEIVVSLTNFLTNLRYKTELRTVYYFKQFDSKTQNIKFLKTNYNYDIN